MQAFPRLKLATACHPQASKGPLIALPLAVYDSLTFHIFQGAMGILKISDQLHDEVRGASRALSRSINAQAEHWLKLGRLCELNPTLTGVELMKQLLAESRPASQSPAMPPQE